MRGEQVCQSVGLEPVGLEPVGLESVGLESVGLESGGLDFPNVCVVSAVFHEVSSAGDGCSVSSYNKSVSLLCLQTFFGSLC